MNENFLYGYDHACISTAKKMYASSFRIFQLKAGIRNTITGEYGINYNPNLQVSNFTNINKLTETSLF